MPILIGNNNSQPIEPSNFWIGGADGKPCQVQNIYIGDSNGEPKLVWTSDFGYSIMTILNTNRPSSETITTYQSGKSNEQIENGLSLMAPHIFTSPLNSSTYEYYYIQDDTIVSQPVKYESDVGSYEKNRTYANYPVRATNLKSPQIEKPNSQTFYYYIQIPVCVHPSYGKINDIPYRAIINSYEDNGTMVSHSLYFNVAYPNNKSENSSKAQLYQACFSSRIWIGDLSNINILFDPHDPLGGSTANSHNWLGWPSNQFSGKTPQLIFEVNTNKQKLRNIPSDTSFDNLATAPRVIAL